MNGEDKKEFNIEDVETRVSELEREILLIRSKEIGQIKVKVGSFTCPAGTGIYSVTGIPFKPRVVEFNIARDSGDDIHQCFGRMDYNGNQHVASLASKDDLQRQAANTDKCLFLINEAGITKIRAVYVSMNTDGFTINVTDVHTAFTIFWKATR